MAAQEFVSTAIFGERAEYYAKYRPSYPAAALDILQRLVRPPANAADIAAGTGIMSRALAAVGYRTVAVEPNPAMRGEIMSGAHAGLRVIKGTGEDTGLPAGSLDLITVAQALHWLDPAATLTEFRRIGRPNCLAAVIWNTRAFTATPFMREYYAMLVDHAPEYSRMRVKWENLHGQAKGFFPSWKLESGVDNTQRWGLATLMGNLWSTSYAPQPGTEGHEAIATAVERLFEKYNVDGHIDFVLKTIMVAGPVEERE
ncbi:MAG: class I SAM-dependent methyltransferase [Pseudonocardiaceae bacterium]